MSEERCPACCARLAGNLPRCACGWRLVTLEEWLAEAPFRQGYLLYMQEDWPGSELREQKNPYDEGTSPWKKFREGAHAAMLSATDSEA